MCCMTTDNFCFYLQNRLIQTSQTGGQWYNDTSPFSFHWIVLIILRSTSVHDMPGPQSRYCCLFTLVGITNHGDTHLTFSRKKSIERFWEWCNAVLTDSLSLTKNKMFHQSCISHCKLRKPCQCHTLHLADVPIFYLNRTPSVWILRSLISADCLGCWRVRCIEILFRQNIQTS